MPRRATSSVLSGRGEVQGAVRDVGFSDKANLDEGTLWPVAYALKQLTAADEAMISSLVKKAVSQSTTSPTPALP